MLVGVSPALLLLIVVVPLLLLSLSHRWAKHVASKEGVEDVFWAEVVIEATSPAVSTSARPGRVRVTARVLTCQVVHLTLLFVDETRIRRTHLLKCVCSLRCVVFVWVEFHGKLLVCSLDVVLR